VAQVLPRGRYWFRGLGVQIDLSGLLVLDLYYGFPKADVIIAPINRLSISSLSPAFNRLALRQVIRISFLG